jgi:hypothetical protein
MSWINDLENKQFEIKTGDGVIFKPLWKKATRSIGFNTTGFDFIGTAGTYVDRKKNTGIRFPIEIYFQGDDNIEQANAFIESSKDSRSWTLTHPQYGEHLVQPLSLNFDENSPNVSKITGVLWETNPLKLPIQEQSAKKDVEVLKSEIDETVIGSSFANLGIPSPEMAVPALSSVNIIESNYSKLALLAEQAAILKDLARKASSSAQNIVSNAEGYLRDAQNLINFPSLIIQDIKAKIASLAQNAANLISIFITNDGSSQAKILYEANATAVVSEVGLVAINGSYETRSEIVEVSEIIAGIYNSMLSVFDSENYEPNPETTFNLDNLINTTLANLFEVAFNAKQERQFILDSDSNPVVLAHRFFGAGDENYQKFINANVLSLDELSIIKKGRIIVYFT